MYQFYYANDAELQQRGICREDIRKQFHITAIRPAMWEEHCLECSAPLCYQNCLYFSARSDGRCKRFENSFTVFPEPRACCGQAAHIKFRKWANMMTIIFPAMLSLDAYTALNEKNQKLGLHLKKVVRRRMPVKLRWETIRTAEFLRRRKLKRLSSSDTTPDAFIFHGYSYMEKDFRLILEIYDDHTPKFKTALCLHPGENVVILNRTQLSEECWKPNYLVKIYPEDNIEAELDIFWCDFIKGNPILCEQPAPTVKCVVWDLDNTIWDGTLIETEQPADLRLRQGVLETIKALDERGVIQSIASKNDEQTAWPVIEHMGLSEYFLYPQIHWGSKSTSMIAIAESLNIGIDSLALIDDMAFEREQVRFALPQVRTYDVSEVESLLSRVEFSLPITEESKKRRSMYRAEERRAKLRVAEHDDIVTFLQKCHLSINLFSPTSDAEKLRCYELVVRTNQLNMSGKKYTPEEFEEVLARPAHKNFAFSCHDDFGEYGIVGYGQYRVENETLIFTEFAMSCRVAGKFVESALFGALLREEHCKSGKFSVLKTKKNRFLRDTLQNIGFCVVSDTSSKVIFSFSDHLKNECVVHLSII